MPTTRSPPAGRPVDQVPGQPAQRDQRVGHHQAEGTGDRDGRVSAAAAPAAYASATKACPSARVAGQRHEQRARDDLAGVAP